MQNTLLLHRIETTPSEWIATSKEFFEALIIRIYESNLKVITSNYSDNFGDCISLTFDDGWASDYEIVFPILKKFCMTATFFITSEWVGKPGYVSWPQLEKMAAAGMEIGSHSASHPYLTSISDKDIEKELVSSKREIENNLGINISAVSFPHGDHNCSVIKAANNAGYRSLFTSVPGLNKNKNSGLYRRNSINSNYSISDIDSLISLQKTKMYGRIVAYCLRNVFKKAIGVEKYISLRNALLFRSKGAGPC
jgi:peptidoglycan/xylan/chitin deacetylase (PgdA/CDA1 family)